ncbi:MAG: tol-pal system YbgF family protein [Kofleriaceae bacterium]
MKKLACLILVLVACKGGAKEGGPFGSTGSSNAVGSAAGSAKPEGATAATGSGSAVAIAAGSGSAAGTAQDPWGGTPSGPPDPWAPKPGQGSGSGSAGSGAGSGSATPAPPSTGKEMPAVEKPVMTPEQAMALVNEAVTRFGQPNPPCAEIVDKLGFALPIAFPKLDKTAIPGLTVYGRCAQAVKRWRASIRAASALLEIGDDNPNVPPAIVRSLSEMGEYDKAIQTAVAFAKQYPKSGDLLMAAATMVFCKAEAWDKCVTMADSAIVELSKKKDADASALAAIRLFRAIGWVVTGKPKEALADIAAIEKERGPIPQFDAIKKTAETTIDRGLYLEVVPLPQLPIGVYHLMGRKDTGALVTIKMREQSKSARQFRVEVEVPGVTERSSNTLSLAANEWSVKWANPPLKMDFDLGKVRGPRPAQLALKITELAKSGDKVIFDETLPIEVLPRDYLPLKRKVGADSMVPTFGYMGAWLTSNDPAIDAFLAKAKERVEGRNFVGEQGATIPQIKALYEELKSRGVSYVMDPNVTADQVFVQRTRLPAEVLATTNAQCLEGTLLFATLFEAIGIKPIIVIVPGHAFVGWHTVPKDGTKGEPLFVETTMVGNADFEAAVRVATSRVATELKQGSFKAGASTFVDVPAIIAAGFTAQPL